MNTDLVNQLKNGGIGIIPTDTIYGIVGSALNPEVVEKIYFLRKRNPDKPFIILIGSMEELEKFGIQLTQSQRDFLKSHWPNPLSVILPIHGNKFKYLHRGTNSLAFRMPKDEKLIKLLKETGPLVAPSANIEGEKPAENIDEAKEYFGNDVDFYREAASSAYVDGELIKGEPSTLISLDHNGKFTILRQGSYKILI